MIIDDRIYWSVLKTKTVTVRVRPQEDRPSAVFRVQNLIDLGGGRQTAILDNISFPALPQKKAAPKKDLFMREVPKDLPTKGLPKKGLEVPYKMANLDFVYTGGDFVEIRNPYETIAKMSNKAKVEKIVTEVLAPGDFLVFKKTSQSKGGLTVEALRPVTKKTRNRYKGHHAP